MCGGHWFFSVCRHSVWVCICVHVEPWLMLWVPLNPIPWGRLSSKPTARRPNWLTLSLLGHPVSAFQGWNYKWAATHTCIVWALGTLNSVLAAHGKRLTTEPSPQPLKCIFWNDVCWNVACTHPPALLINSLRCSCDASGTDLSSQKLFHKTTVEKKRKKKSLLTFQCGEGRRHLWPRCTGGPQGIPDLSEVLS